jgi:hypothetical protein
MFSSSPLCRRAILPEVAAQGLEMAERITGLHRILVKFQQRYQKSHRPVILASLDGRDR